MHGRCHLWLLSPVLGSLSSQGARWPLEEGEPSRSECAPLGSATGLLADLARSHDQNSSYVYEFRCQPLSSSLFHWPSKNEGVKSIHHPASRSIDPSISPAATMTDPPAIISVDTIANLIWRLFFGTAIHGETIAISAVLD